jgi:hypothetical protein
LATGDEGIALIDIVEAVLHPLLLVYVIVALQVDVPVTVPEFETVAMPVLEDCHAFVAGVVDPVKVVALPLQIDKFPVIVGKLLTVIVTILE